MKLSVVTSNLLKVGPSITRTAEIACVLTVYGVWLHKPTAVRRALFGVRCGENRHGDEPRVVRGGGRDIHRED